MLYDDNARHMCGQLGADTDIMFGTWNILTPSHMPWRILVTIFFVFILWLHKHTHERLPVRVAVVDLFGDCRRPLLERSVTVNIAYYSSFVFGMVWARRFIRGERQIVSCAKQTHNDGPEFSTRGVPRDYLLFVHRTEAFCWENGYCWDPWGSSVLIVQQQSSEQPVLISEHIAGELFNPTGVHKCAILIKKT